MSGELKRDEMEPRPGAPNGDHPDMSGGVPGIGPAGALPDLAARGGQDYLYRILENIADGILITSNEGQFLFVNSAAEALLGVPRDEILRRNFFDPYWRGRITTLDGQAVQPQDFLFQRVLESRKPLYGVERLVRRPDGTQVIISANLSPLFGEAEAVVGVVTSFSDVTLRRRAEEAVRRSEEHFRALVEQSLEAVALADANCTIRYMSQSSQRILGYEPAELVGRDAFELLHPGERDATRRLVADLSREPGKVIRAEFRMRHKDGLYRIIEGTATNRLQEPSVRAIVFNFHDVTERRQADAALRSSEERYRLLFERNLAGVFRTTVYGHVLDCNDAFARILGCSSRQEVMALPMTDFYFDPAERETFLDELRSHRLLTNFELRMRRRDGSLVWGLENVSLLLGGDGEEFLEGTLVDITERKTAEAKYRSLLENLEQSIFLKDRDLCFVAVNRPFCEAVGRSETEIIGRNDFDFFPAQLAEQFRADDLTVLRDGKRLELQQEILVGGEPRHIRVVKTAVRDDKGQNVGVLGISWDITEQLSLEAQLRQSQKMEAIGQLAGGVAHDFNNLLTAILGNLSLLAADLPAGDPHHELVAAAESAALRAATLTRQLLGFSRQTVLRPHPTNVNNPIDEVVRLLRRTIDRRIALETVLAPDLWTVLADPGQINQILMNLCLNARDAMPQGGRLVLETANVLLTEATVHLHLDARPGDFVRLTVSDTGEGMAPEVRARIFEPFFTTKGLGKGTGLGLAVVFGIVKQHQGWIDCTSHPQQGTRFDIFLPRDLSRAGAAAEEARGPGSRKGHETILLVDDEPMLRELGRHILSRFGYEVLLAEDGQHALEVFQQRRSTIDLVLLDLAMPRLSGRDTFRQLQQLDPEVRVLFASGYSSEHLTDSEQEQSLGFVSKPYSPDDLVHTVRSALDRAARRPVTRRLPAADALVR
jgi:PAS domain S-box-containing protein